MNVFLETSDKAIISKVASTLSEEYFVDILDGIQNTWLNPDRTEKEPATIYFGENIFGHLPVGDRRLAHLAFATEGDILFSDRDVFSPMYVGEVPRVAESRVSTHLKYASRRKDLFGKNYIGQTYVDPKNVLVYSEGFEHIKDVLKHAPDNWWYSIGFLKATSTKRVVEFFEDFPYVQPVVLDSGTLDILSGTDVEYSDASELDFTTPRSGILLRELTRRPETWGVSIE